jgi:hypothetical protein
MKKVLMGLSMIAIVATAVNASGHPTNDNAKTQVIVGNTDNGHFNLLIAAEDKGQLQVKIKDESGKAFLDRNIHFKGTSEVSFDVSELIEGQYIVEVEGLNISMNQKVFLSKLYEKDVAAQLISLGNDKVRLKVFHESKTPVSVKIYDESGKLCFKNKVKEIGNFSQDFDFSKMDSKNYSVIISGEKTTIRKFI